MANDFGFFNQQNYRFYSVGIAERYDSLTPDSKNAYSLEEVQALDNERGFENLVTDYMVKNRAPEKVARGVLFAERMDLKKEIIAMEYMADVRGGFDKLTDIDNRYDLIDIFNGQPGAQYEAALSKGKGTSPAVNGVTLTYTYISEKQRCAMEKSYEKTQRYFGSFRKFNCVDDMGKLLSQDKIKVSEYKALLEKRNEGAKVLKLANDIKTYVSQQRINELFKSDNPLESFADEARKFFKEVDLKYIYTDKLGFLRETVKCTEGVVNNNQLVQLGNAFRSKASQKLLKEFESKNNGKPLDINQSKEFTEKLNYMVAKEVERISDSMTYSQAKAEIGNLPISEVQKFTLNKILGVPEEKTKNLTRSNANELIIDVKNSIADKEVGPKVLAYAKEYNLVKPGETYTNTQWVKDCQEKNIPPMPEFKALAEDLGLYQELDEVSKKKNGDELNHNDYIKVLTNYYNKFDEHMNGPVESYQLNAHPDAAYCKNWQEAEKLYIQQCVVSNLIGDAEAFYVAHNVGRHIPGVNTSKLLNPELSDIERKELAEKTQRNIQRDMIDTRCKEIKNAFVSSGSKNISNIVKVAIKNVCKGCSTKDEFVAATKNKNNEIFKECKNLMGNKPVYASDINKIISAVIRYSPGMVGAPGYYKDRVETLRQDAVKILGSSNGGLGNNQPVLKNQEKQAELKPSRPVTNKNSRIDFDRD